MALLWVEGFESFGQTVDANPSPSGVLARKYQTSATPTAQYIKTGRFGGYALQFRNTTSYVEQLSLTTNATCVIGCAVKWNSWPSATAIFLHLMEGALSFNLRITTGGEIAVYRATTLLGTTSGAGLSLGAWAYLELKVTSNDTTGSYELRINGVEVLSDSDIDTKVGSNAYYEGFRIQGTSTSDAASLHWDDFYFLDGSAGLNDFLGDSRVIAIRPNFPGDSAQFTPSSGDNYAAVNEAVSNDDTTYVEDDTSNQLDLYNYDALGVSYAIHGVQVNTMVKKTDATAFSLKTVCKSGATTSEDAGVAAASDYTVKRRVLATDPNTSQPWTKTNLEAAQFGVKVA